MSQSAKRRMALIEGQKETATLAEVQKLGSVAVAESLYKRLPTIDDWVRSKQDEFEKAFVSLDLTDETNRARIVAIQAQKQLLGELVDMLATAEEKPNA